MVFLGVLSSINKIIQRNKNYPQQSHKLLYLCRATIISKMKDQRVIWKEGTIFMEDFEIDAIFTDRVALSHNDLIISSEASGNHYKKIFICIAYYRNSRNTQSILHYTYLYLHVVVISFAISIVKVGVLQFEYAGMGGIQCINVMSIESKSKLVYLFQCFIAIDYYLHITKDNDWLGKVFCLWSTVVILLSNACLEGTIEVEIIDGQLLLDGVVVDRLEVVVSAFVEDLYDGNEQVLRVKTKRLKYFDGRTMNRDVLIYGLNLFEEIRMCFYDGITQLHQSPSFALFGS